MSDLPVQKSSSRVWNLMKQVNRFVENVYSRGIRPRGVVLLLTTIGRKTGIPHITPLQYEEINDKYYIGSARGNRADWYINILKNNKVGVQIGDEEFKALAEPITDPEKIADFLEIRLKYHPIMLRLMMITEGLPLRFNRQDLIRIACEKTIVALIPLNG